MPIFPMPMGSLPRYVLVWLETPTNPMLKVVDLEHVAAIARAKKVLVACDNTFASPWTQRPLEYGFDLVMHSTTKYLNGHSDMVGGIVIVGDNVELRERMAFLQNAVGAIQGPFDSFLALRGVKTLALRMERQSASALRIAQWLSEHPRIHRVHYPGLVSHPQHELARRQMRAFGAMIAVEVAGSADDARRFLERQIKRIVVAYEAGRDGFWLARWLRARGVEAYVIHPASIAVSREHRRAKTDRLDTELFCLREAMALASSTMSWAISERSSWKAVRVGRGMASAGLAGGTSTKQAIHFLGDL